MGKRNACLFIIAVILIYTALPVFAEARAYRTGNDIYECYKDYVAVTERREDSDAALMNCGSYQGFV
ncbi:MAG: hypothetical protein R6V46_16645, partial [Desulfatiglandaceae bacterium]